MGRPTKDPGGAAADATLTIRLTADDRALLDRLVAARRAELADDAVEVTATSYIRAIIRREGRILDAKRVDITSAKPEPAPVVAKPAKPEPAPVVAKPELEPDEPEAVRAALYRATASGRTQKDIARAAGINSSRISRFARHEGGLSTESLSKLARVLT